VDQHYLYSSRFTLILIAVALLLTTPSLILGYSATVSHELTRLEYP
jgi:hypothetical protein